ncbi:DNA polymerase delta subunit 2 [Nematocida sp. LUAm3]|nr:DNA polymerase delta subunit 2 [Nematocida sp. LUAm3]KAI5173653.1 DNA polymerase delta subunit 2 [Nematocida sp. LUAm2]KAI5176874.1 DNA polymerase delta subunit 2 [Nematocida sp. LUAm1]
MYNTQYSEMYKDRVKRLGQLVEEGWRKRGISLEKNKGNSFISGIIMVDTKRASITKCIYEVEKEEDLPKEESISEKKYFLERIDSERVELLPPNNLSKYLINGAVLGLLGRTSKDSFIVEDIIFPYEALPEDNRKKRVNSSSPSGALISGISNYLEKQEKQKLIENLNNIGIENIFIYENLILSSNGKENQKENPLNEFLSVFSSSSVSLIPGPNDKTLPMLPYANTSLTSLNLNSSHKVINIPTTVLIGETEILLCALPAVKSLLSAANFLPNNEKYFWALKQIVKCLHSSPCAPDALPAYPSKRDPFVLERIPNAVALVVDEGHPELRTISLSHHSIDLLILTNSPSISTVINGKVSLTAL